jgi:hypothetical protein
MTQLPQYQNPLAIAMPPGFECARVSVKVTSENYRDVIAFVAKAVRNGVPLFAPDEIPPGAENSAQPYRVCPPGEAEAAPKRRKPSIATLPRSFLQRRPAARQPCSSISRSVCPMG